MNTLQIDADPSKNVVIFAYLNKFSDNDKQPRLIQMLFHIFNAQVVTQQKKSPSVMADVGVFYRTVDHFV